MNTEAGIGGMWSQAKECPDAPGAARGRKGPPSSVQRQHSPADTLTSKFWPPGLCEINFWCFKPLGWWQFVMAAPGH